jgi:PleD family two-component response regulator
MVVPGDTDLCAAIGKADRALYRAKLAGCGRSEVELGAA